jgi:hypothetical protein
MLFYSILFVGVLSVAFIALWLFRKIAVISEIMFRKGIPNSKQAPAAHLNKNGYGRNLKRASKTWSRKRPATPEKLAPRIQILKQEEPEHFNPGVAMTKEANLNGFLARKSIKDQASGNWKPNITSSIRDDRSGIAGRAYQPSQQAISKFAIETGND